VVRTGHSSALFGAAPALVGTAATMLRLMLRTLGSAGVANFGANPTDVMGELRSAAHVTRRRPANLGAVAIEPDAFGHHCDIVFA
jgi:hypothetical protein